MRSSQSRARVASCANSWSRDSSRSFRSVSERSCAAFGPERSRSVFGPAPDTAALRPGRGGVDGLSVSVDLWAFIGTSDAHLARFVERLATGPADPVAVVDRGGTGRDHRVDRAVLARRQL